ncbi:histone H3 methyltransferase Clr4 [Mucor lusitanicus]
MSNNTSVTNQLAADEFVVSRIAGTKKQNGTRYFLVEWDGYALNENTWEQEHNVYSEQAIKDFYNTYRREKHLAKNFDLDSLESKLLLINSYDPDTQLYTSTKLPAIKSSVTSTKTTTTTTTTTTTANSKAIASKVSSSKKTTTTKLFLNPPQPPKAGKKRSRASLESETNSVMVAKPVKMKNDKEKVPKDQLEVFEQTIKTVKRSVENKFPIVRTSNSKNARAYAVENLKAKVSIINEIDDESPASFIYIDQLKYTAPVQPPDPDFLTGCGCSRFSDCIDACHDVSAYGDDGRLTISQGTAIYECNQSCECGARCKNRVVQRGRKIPLQVYKTKGKGWGVQSLQDIPKGTFIEEYIGEVITVEEGDNRGVVYDVLGCSYLFDMDFAQSELLTKYVIDSYALGNVSRFFNHSCSPNLEVFAVFYDSADNQMHRLAFFAKRDIHKNEELCFDYNGRTDVSNDERNKGAARYACHCEAPGCRKWIYQ